MTTVNGCTCSEEPQAPSQTARSTPPPPAPAQKPVTREIPKSLREQLEVKADLVGQYPSDAPVYENANLSSSNMSRGKATAVFSTAKSPDDTEAWTREFAEGQGWQLLPTMDIEGGKLLQGTQGSRELSVLISEVEADGALTMIVVAVSP
jgi:hypothetical protein